MTKWYGGIEGGSTKFVCVVGTGPGDIQREERFPTTTPVETLDKVITFFKQAEQDFGKLSSLGMTSFGPIDSNPVSPTYGYILQTPKPKWSNANVLGMLKSAFDIPVAFDLDVNGAALSEARWGAAQGLDTFIYLSVGAGIGGSAIVNGKLMHGLLHPEMGHILLPHDRERDPFEGTCPFHKDCFEGLASFPAMKNRWGQLAETIPDGHPAWELEADYIALAIANLIFTISPQRIIIGGEILQHPSIFPQIRRKVRSVLNGYLVSELIQNKIDEFIIPPMLWDNMGILGALALAGDPTTDAPLPEGDVKKKKKRERK